MPLSICVISLEIDCSDFSIFLSRSDISSEARWRGRLLLVFRLFILSRLAVYFLERLFSFTQISVITLAMAAFSAGVPRLLAALVVNKIDRPNTTPTARSICTFAVNFSVF